MFKVLFSLVLPKLVPFLISNFAQRHDVGMPGKMKIAKLYIHGVSLLRVICLFLVAFVVFIQLFVASLSRCFFSFFPRIRSNRYFRMDGSGQLS